jgi:hypothetical protein
LKEVVFAPDLIGAAFIDPHARAVLERWRDGQFKTVLNRQLLLLHLKTVRDLGVPPHLLKRWTLWFTTAEKSIYFSDSETEEMNPIKLCEALSETAPIISFRKPESTSRPWITPVEFH